MSDTLKDTQQAGGRGRIRDAVLTKSQCGLLSLHSCKLQDSELLREAVQRRGPAPRPWGGAAPSPISRITLGKLLNLCVPSPFNKCLLGVY